MSDKRKLRDRSVPMSGIEKTQRVDLGLALLSLVAIPGVPLTHEDIAAWCGCTQSGIWALEKEVMKKLRTRILFGRAAELGAELRDKNAQRAEMPGAAEVRRLIDREKPLTPEETRRALVRQIRPQSRGRAGLPEYAVRLMYEDYKRLGSLSKAGKLHGRTRQSMYQIFESRGLPLNERKFQNKIRYGGRKFTPGKDGYFRATSGDRIKLHYAIWQDAHGAVPAGHQVTFRNADHTDVRLDNLACMPIREVTLFHHARHQSAATPCLSKDSLFRSALSAPSVLK